MSKHTCWIALLTLFTFTATEILAQGGRRRRGGRRISRPTPPPEPEKKKEDKKPKTYLAIKNADVYVGTGQRIRNCDILIADDKIEKVGPGIKIPEKAKIIDAKNKVVSPGYIAVKASGIGMPRYGSRGGKDASVKDSINPFDPTIKMGLAAGITSYCSLSGSGSGKPGGTSALIKLAYGDLGGMVLQEKSVMSMRVPLTMAQMKSLRDLIKKAKEHKKALAKHLAEAAKTPTPARGTPKPATGTPPSGRGRRVSRGAASAASAKKPPKPPKGTEDILKVMDGEVKLWITGASNNDWIRQAMKVAELLGVGVVLDGPTTAWSIPDEVAAQGSMAIVNPRELRRPDPARKDTTGSNIRMCAILAEAGVPVAVTVPGGRFGGAGLGTGGILGQDLHTIHIDAAYAVRGGLDNAKALRTITLDAAKIVGADARIGSIEAGKDADILILDGDPLHYRTFVQTAIVNGKLVYEKDKEPFYRHIKR
ncbi:MAG: amidohydrolase family protein [Planctomycetota bacterium]